MRVHEVDVTNLIPVKPFESFIATLENRRDHWVIKTVVGDLVELKKYQENEK